MKIIDTLHSIICHFLVSDISSSMIVSMDFVQTAQTHSNFFLNIFNWLPTIYKSFKSQFRDVIHYFFALPKSLQKTLQFSRSVTSFRQVINGVDIALKWIFIGVKTGFTALMSHTKKLAKIGASLNLPTSKEPAAFVRSFFIYVHHKKEKCYEKSNYQISSFSIVLHSHCS